MPNARRIVWSSIAPLLQNRLTRLRAGASRRRMEAELR
jgi:hypothetical protein